MTWAEKQVGPHSKYNKTHPYTYEARVSVLEWDDAYNSYYSDTICGLIDFLKQKNIRPDQVTIYEVYQDHEEIVDTCLCLDNHDLWLSRPGLCRALKDYYKGHIDNDHCRYHNRSRIAYSS
ncbi:MAG: hypothetical protein OEY52_02460 [Gammaproteobacteria bacterium]|nr:hypothetical protein [Gammaproteobacteria bacterium]